MLIGLSLTQPDTVNLSDYFREVFGESGRSDESQRTPVQVGGGIQLAQRSPSDKRESALDRDTIIRGVPDRYVFYGGAAFFLMLLLVLISKR